MCGIVGIVRRTTRAAPISAHNLTQMRDCLAHRGPDDAGIWLDPEGRAAFGHRRLSIIDLDHRASQPMQTTDGRFTITFNGEIYNYAEIREELVKLGETNWRSVSDTEVLLNAFRVWGVECIERLRGMFAFAIWDSKEKTVWLIRDRIGIKPLYYHLTDDTLTFASEIKALLQDPNVPRRMDETSLFHFLSFMTCPAPATMFAGISKLAGGTWLRLDLRGSVEVRRYWDAADEAQRAKRSLPAREQDVIEAVRAELSTSVAYRGVADVPVGIFLSGGIDSSTNAALFARTQSGPIRTFSIGYRGQHQGYENELPYARMMAEHIGSEHHERLLQVDELIALVPKIIHLQDEPIADPVCFPLYCVAELARSTGTIVAQVGEGADELFAGYPSWHRLIRLHDAAKRLGRAGAGLARAGLALAGKGDGLLSETLRRASNGDPFFWSGAEIFPGKRKERLLSDRMRTAFSKRSSFEALADIESRFVASSLEKSPLNWMSYVDLNLRLPELLLMRVDKMSMGVGLECRVPFLDHKLVGMALAVPTEIKMGGGNPKSILKKAVDGLIPSEIITRKKQGFGVPLADWFDGRLKDVMQSEIRGFLKETDVLDPKRVEDLFQTGDGVHSWFIYNLACWHRYFIREWPAGKTRAA